MFVWPRCGSRRMPPRLAPNIVMRFVSVNKLTSYFVKMENWQSWWRVDRPPFAMFTGRLTKKLPQGDQKRDVKVMFKKILTWKSTYPRPLCTTCSIFAYAEILLHGPPCHFIRFLTHSKYNVGPTDWRINGLTLQTTVLLEKSDFPRLIKKCPVLYRICVFFTVSRKTRH
jgi:hypothetical protein